jgi:hypothetical protein
MTENIQISIDLMYDYSSPIMNEEKETFRASFMTPKPQSPKHNKFVPSVLSKRKFEDAFGVDNFDDERYGQHISSDFFVNSQGHNVYYRASEK